MWLWASKSEQLLIMFIGLDKKNERKEQMESPKTRSLFVKFKVLNKLME